jgi:hypothetical protein
LLVNPNSGKVDAHKSPLKDSTEFEISGTQPNDEVSSVSSKRSNERGTRDWPAIIVVVVFLLTLIAAGFCFAVNFDIV